MFNIQTYKASVIQRETNVWRKLILSNGGGVNSNSIKVANTLMLELRKRSYFNKIIYLLPLLGQGIIAARVPLIDRLNSGIATNTGFTDSAFSETTGLQGDGVNYFTLTIKPSQLGTTNNAGFGIWVKTLSGNGWTFSCRSANASEIYGLFASTSDELFYYGPGGSDTRTNSTASNSHYYAQRSAANDRKLYRNASQIAATTGSYAASDANTNTLNFMALDASNITGNRITIAYLTSGDLTVAEIQDFHSVLQLYLLGPAGK
jgi:hypothetical protein